MGKTKIRWGILGPGKIAGKFIQDLKLSERAKIVAVASRDATRAEQFKDQHGLSVAFDNYESLATYPGVDIVYVATPHAFHAQHSILCLNNGKHVLCEKPMAINASQVREMIELARQRKLFLMEAVWTAFFPYMQDLKRILEKQQLGLVRLIEADFGFNAPHHPGGRLFNPELGGGALLDVGIYPVFFALFLFGKPDEIYARAHLGTSGVDEFSSIHLTWKDGKYAHLHCSVSSESATTARITGTKGCIEIPSRWHESKIMRLIDDKNRVKECDYGDPFRGYKYEIEEVNTCILQGRIQSETMPWSFSLELSETLDTIREQISLSYPMDSNA